MSIADHPVAQSPSQWQTSHDGESMSRRARSPGPTGRRVGYGIARELASERNAVTVVDVSPHLIDHVTTNLDVRGVVGHGSHPDVLNTATWDEQMNVNARGVFLGMRAVIPQMQAAGGGSGGAIDVVAEIPLLGAAHRKGYHN